MITSIRNIKRNFFQLFLGASGEGFTREYVSITDDEGTELHQVPLVYFHLSSGDIVQAPYERYPVISVQDYLPVPVERWNNWPQKRISGFADTDNDGKFDKAGAYPKGIRLRCRYEVSVAARDEKTFTDITDWFYRNFGFSDTEVFLFNKTVIAGIPHGDVVNYTLTEIRDNPRGDGIYENVYVFDLTLWADLKPVTEYTDLVTEIQVQFNQQDELVPTINGFDINASAFINPGHSDAPIGVTVTEN